MKIPGLLTLVLFILSIIYIECQTPNFLKNGGFEESKNGIMPDNWSGDSRVYSISDISFSGKYSLKYSNNDAALYKLCTQTLNIEPGHNYYAGVRIKTMDITGSDFGASFCIEWEDGNGKWLGGTYPKGIKGTNDWTEINSVVSIPAAAKKINFCCYVRKGMTGTAWFDDAFIQSYTTGKMHIELLSPVYRGLIFSDRNEDIVISVKLNDPNIRDSYLTAVLSDSTHTEILKEEKSLIIERDNYIIKLAPDSLANGNYTLTVTLSNQNEGITDSWSTSIRKIGREDRPEVYFDNHKRLIVNNKKIFPLGMYWSSITEEDLKIYSQSKFNFLLPYSQPTDTQMNLVQKYNLKVIYSVKDYYAFTKFAPPEIKSTADESRMLMGTVEKFRNSPALLAWYNNDEYPPEFIDRLNQHYSIISTLDPNHPVLSIIINPLQSDLYLNSTDVIGSDPYVIPNLPLNKVGEAVSTISQKTDDSRPIWMVIQAHNMGNYKEFIPNPQDYRAPTYEEMRNMSWQAICQGANGLIYYSYFDLKRNLDVSFATQWSNLKRIVGEIDSYSDILLSEMNNDSVKIESLSGDNSWFNWTMRNYNDRLYIFVVANGKSNGELKLYIPEKYHRVAQFNDNMKPILKNHSVYNDSIGNLDLKIYVAE